MEGELVRSLMRAQRHTLPLAVLLIALIVGVLWDDVPTGALVAWGALALAAAAGLPGAAPLRERGAAEGHRRTPGLPRRYRMLWPASPRWCGGLPTLLYFDRSPLADQFICWLMLAGLAMFSVNSLSSQLQTMRA